MSKFIADYTVTVSNNQESLTLNARQCFDTENSYYGTDDRTSLITKEARDSIQGAIEMRNNCDLYADAATVTINKVTHL